jgi:D-3-phosphoglycerate dehydrogenase / 2-oxoglutarate reductase
VSQVTAARIDAGHPASGRTVVALDTLLDDVALETATAEDLGWRLRRWDGDPADLKSADAVVHVRTRIDGQLIGRLASCTVIGRFGTGLDSVDRQAAAAAGITVVNVRDYCTAELAAHTVGLALTLFLRLGPRHDNAAGQTLSWQRHITANQRVGDAGALVIGYGAVGRRVADALAGLGLHTMVTTRRASTVPGPRVDVVDLLTGLERADIVVIQRELSAATRGFFGAGLLEHVRPDAILVNTARKDLMDQAAVAAALRRGRLGGIGLDAKLDPDEPIAALLGHPRVLVTPHIGWYSERSLTELRRRTIADTISAYAPPPLRDRKRGPTGTEPT